MNVNFKLRLLFFIIISDNKNANHKNITRQLSIIAFRFRLVAPEVTVLQLYSRSINIVQLEHHRSGIQYSD